GYLILGTSESIGRHVELYRPVSRKWRIYRRVGGARPGRAGFPVQTGSYRHQPYRAYPQHGLDNLTELTRNILLQDYAPAAVVIDLHYEVLHYSGNTRLYLQQPGGSPSNDLLTLVPTSLRPRIRAAVHQAMQASRRVDIGAIPLQRDDRDALVSIGVQPLPDPQRQEPLFLVTFRDEPETPPHGAAGDRTTGAGPDDSLVQQLEYELKTSREELHSTIEELESSNEELNASNEEVMSMNEELQSTNEELESSKEELQSVNEELITVNTQLRDKIAELEETNNDLTNLMTSVDTAILFIGVDGVIRRFTPRVTSLFNVIDSDLGRPLGDINRRFEDPQLQQDIDRVMQDLAPHLREVQSDSGQWFQRAITPYRTASNQIEGVVLSFTDITRIKHAELELQRLAETLEQRVAERTSELENEVGMRAAAQAALQESEQRFRAVFNDAPVGMCQADPGDGQLLLVNPEVCAMTGYSEAELLQRALPEILHPQDREAGRELLARLMRGELPLYQAQQRFIRRDGTVLWGDLRVMLVRDHQGQPLHSVAVIADITERKQLAAQLLQERNFGNTVLDTVASLILVIDADGKLVRFNRACEVLTGYDFDEFVGSADWWTLVPAEEHDALQRIMQRLLSGEELLARESRWLTRDGAVKLLSWRYTVIRDPAGQAQYIIGSGIDITDQREAEDEARQHLEEASRLQRLQTAGELATMLAHELNQPLGAIAMYAETGEHLLASETLDQDRLTDILAQISQQSLRAAEIIRRLRAFVSQGRIDSRPLDLGMVVRNACELMAPEARKFGIGLHSEQDDGLGQVMGVEVHIEQVLLNLIRNAIQAIHDSGTRDGSITISIRRVADVARVSVLDNGPGIDPAAAEDLFALLASHKKAGLGVGLRISRSLIEAQGGRLWAEAHKPGGIFHFELPLSA
ncbi:MAG: PAS domain S-box protein, partial [Gammaproteobacteria bacterium]